MARMMGKPGRHAAEEVLRRWVWYVVVGCVCEFALGFAVGLAVTSGNWIVCVALVALMVGGTLVVKRHLRRIGKELDFWKKGYRGEEAVATALVDDLPDSYCVVNDLSTEFGNVDHVVVGPTGVFAVETKNWRGTVTNDEKGGLLLNERPPDRPTVRRLTSTIVRMRERWVALGGTDRYIQGVIVFPLAYEKTDWAKTRNVHCISIDRIPGYFLEQEQSKPLSKKEVSRLARAFLALARMDEGFDDPASGTQGE